MSAPLPPLKTTILDRITSEQICPRSRWFFRSVECVVWTAWLLSVLVGGVAVAVTLYVVRLRQYDLYEVTHGNFWYALAEALPYLWLITLVFMVALAVYNLRHTARGYRYPLWAVLSSSMLGSAVLGGGLHLLNVGFMVDRSFGEYMPTYPSQMKRDEAMWQKPGEGRLIGRLYLPAEASSTIVQFIDMQEVVWAVETKDLTADDLGLIATAAKVRLMGVQPSSTPALFYACGAFPWHMDAPATPPELAATRQGYEERMRRYANDRVRMGQVVAERGTEAFTSSSPCMELPALKRM